MGVTACDNDPGFEELTPENIKESIRRDEERLKRVRELIAAGYTDDPDDPIQVADEYPT